MDWAASVGCIETYNSDRTYQPIDDGKLAAIIAVDREVSDLVAWFPNNPSQWWLRYGIAPILNPLALEKAIHFDMPLRIFASPAEWLEGSGDGISILDWKSNVPFWLSGVPRLLVADPDLAEQISATFKILIPEIRIESEVTRAAA